jgi:predicted amidophosphoribosyltransferase
MTEYYCGPCDKLVRKPVCSSCGADADKIKRPKLTRQEGLQWLADRGIDTWEDYRCER